MNEALMNGGDACDSDELLQAQAHIWNHIFNFINSMSLKCAVELGIPDVIHSHGGGGKPTTVSELIDALNIDKTKAPFVYRLMRILTHSGFFVRTTIPGNEKEEEVGYTLTSASKLLLKENPSSVSPFLLAMLDPMLTDPWHRLSHWFRNDDLNPFVSTHGKKLWEMADQESRLNKFFNEAMASDARLVSGLVTGKNKRMFEGLNSLVDVAGGTGTMAKAIAETFPAMKCTVLDLPHVVKGLEGTENLSYIGGDMFQSIPPSDAVLLKWILHDWSDKECVEILKKCKEAIPSKEKGGKVMILDMVLGDEQKNTTAGGDDSEASTETKLFFDMLMMVLVTGTERTEKEWANLFLQAGFCDYKITPMLGLRSLIEVYYY